MSDLIAFVGFARAMTRHRHIARPAQCETDVVARKIVDIAGRIELCDIRADFFQRVVSSLVVGRILAVRIAADIVERDRKYVRRRVEHPYTATFQLAQIFGLEEDVPVIERRIVAENLLTRVTLYPSPVVPHAQGTAY